MQKVAEFWTQLFNWWENLSGILIKDRQVIEECILFGFPSDSDIMQVPNFCILYAKYYIYIQCLFNNNTLDLIWLTDPTQASITNRRKYMYKK